MFAALKYIRTFATAKQKQASLAQLGRARDL